MLTSTDPLHDFTTDLLAKQPLAGRHILVIVENLPVPFDRRVWMEAVTLKLAGADVSVICPTGKGYEAREEVIEGIRIYRHPLPLEASGLVGYLLEYGSALFWEMRLAIKVARRRSIDVIHGCNPPDLIFLVALPFKLFGTRYLFDHHDINPELFEAKFNGRGFLWRLIGLFERLSFAAARVSIATNESYRQIAQGRGKKKPEDVFVVRSGPDLTRLTPVPPNPRWKQGRQFLVGYVGVMGDQEGIDLLLAAVRHLVKIRRREDIQFVLVGGGPALNDLKGQATQMGLEHHVTFTGRASDADLFEVLSTSDVCVNPDRVNPMNSSSTMNKILEYMAFGKPIVQFDVREGRVSAGISSLYAAANDAEDLALKIEELLDDPARRREMGRAGRERIESELSWPHQVPSLIAAYERVLR